MSHNFKPKYETTIPEGFTMQTHFFDGFGKLVGTKPYTLHVKGDKQFFEQPKHSKNLWYGSGEPAGRLEYDKQGQKVFNVEAKHEQWTPPLSGTEKMYADLQAAEQKNAALLAELEEIKKEQASKLEAQKLVAQAKATAQEKNTEAKATGKAST